jgi:Spy/CpxP family protein refolding chaperone
MNIRRIHALLLVAALAVPLGVMADSSRGGPPGYHHKRARLFLVLRMADALDLSDEKALQVNHLLEQVELKRDDLRKQRDVLNEQIRGALDEPQPDDAKLAKLIDQAIDLDSQQARAFEDSFNALKKVLTVEQQAKLVLLRAKLHGEVHPRERGFRSGGMERWHRGGPEADDDTPPRPPAPPHDGPDSAG